MVSVDIFHSQSGDIIVIDTGQYLTGTLFDYIVEYLRRRVSNEILDAWFWDCNEDNIESCLAYNGLAIKLFRGLRDRKAAAVEIKQLTEEALDAALG